MTRHFLTVSKNKTIDATFYFLSTPPFYRIADIYQGGLQRNQHIWNLQTFFKGADEKMNPLDFFFSKSANQKNLGLRFLPSLRGVMRGEKGVQIKMDHS